MLSCLALPCLALSSAKSACESQRGKVPFGCWPKEVWTGPVGGEGNGEQGGEGEMMVRIIEFANEGQPWKQR